MPEISSGKPVNEATPKVVKSSSKFNLSYPVGGTYRFGEYAPHFVMECVPNDRNVRLQSVHEARSTSLKAPLMSDIKLNKDYFRVNMEAILPLNWDKIYTNPTIGEDVNASLCNATIPSVFAFLNSLEWYFRRGILTYPTDDENNSEAMVVLLNYIVGLEKFFSRGSLMASLGINLANYYKVIGSDDAYSGTPRSFDEASELSISLLKEAIFNYHPLVAGVKYFEATDSFGYTYRVCSSQDDVKKILKYNSNLTVQVIDWNTFMSIYRDDCIFSIRFLDSLSDRIDITDAVNVFRSASEVTDWAPSDDDNNSKGDTKAEPDHQRCVFMYDALNDTEDIDLNISRIWAYQLAVSHFYTNDKVDFVFSAELYRQLIHYLFMDIFHTWDETNPRTNTVDTFQLNGLTYEYDYLSGRYFDVLMDYLIDASEESESTVNLSDRIVKLLNAIFSFRNSLRFKDYFTGSRTQPLAVGDTSVAVNNNAVSVIDTVQKTQIARFLNAVNRGKRQFKSYIENLFPGLNVVEDQHNPFWLAHTSDTIYSNEVENTAEAQQTEAISVTSTLRSNASRYAFEIDVDRPCIILGVLYFDIERYYGDSVERQNLHVDRFDMFNPFMQFIGDQEVYQIEKGQFNESVPPLFPFSYQLRHAEYKQRYPQFFGGFADTLPGWLFKYQPSNFPYMTPRFIRSNPSELDQFYISLTGNTLASYYHFIIKSRNIVEADRPMVYAPSIL